jgi:hypothetical protein
MYEGARRRADEIFFALVSVSVLTLSVVSDGQILGKRGCVFSIVPVFFLEPDPTCSDANYRLKVHL